MVKATVNSKYPKQIQKALVSCYKKKMSTQDTAKKVNSLLISEKSGITLSKRSVATIFGNFTRNWCSWHHNY